MSRTLSLTGKAVDLSVVVAWNSNELSLVDVQGVHPQEIFILSSHARLSVSLLWLRGKLGASFRPDVCQDGVLHSS